MGKPEGVSQQQADVAAEFDRYTAIYSQTVNDSLIVPGLDVDYFTRVKASMLVEYVGSNLAPASSRDTIDVGCGVGNYHTLLAGKFKSLTGVDVSAESIEKAKAGHPDVNYQSYGGDRLPFADASFDVAYAICVVHHVPVPAWPVFFAEMNRVLRPGGHAMIFEHNPYNPLTRRVVDRCPFDADAVLLKPGKTKELLTGAGFANVQARSILSIPSFGPLSRKLDLALGILPFGAQYLATGVKQ